MRPGIMNELSCPLFRERVKKRNEQKRKRERDIKIEWNSWERLFVRNSFADENLLIN